MGELDIGQATTTSLKTQVRDYQVDAGTLDEAEQLLYYDFSKAKEHLGYYKNIPELKKAIDALAVWTVGKGFSADTKTRRALEFIHGWGEDSFQSIMWNIIVQKKIFGDGFAEIIRDPESLALINLKPNYSGNIRIYTDKQGIISHYEERLPNGKINRINREDMFHISNDRVANEIHGTSIIDAVKWVIDARNEAMEDYRRVLHRSTIRVLYVDMDNATKLATLKTQYKEAIKAGELLVLPGKPGDAGFQDLIPPSIDSFLKWIQYFENFFYQAVGIPRVIATSQDYTEAASKVGYLTFEPIYTREQTLLEQDLYAQLGLRVKFNRPPSLGGVLQEDEQKNAGQTGFQPNETKATVGRNE